MTAIFVGAGGELLPDLYVNAARPAIIVGSAVLLVAAGLALLLPAGRSSRSPVEEDPVPAEPSLAR
jgi:hypothetical protein